jgi:hypothetical protein
MFISREKRLDDQLRDTALKLSQLLEKLGHQLMIQPITKRLSSLVKGSSSLLLVFVQCQTNTNDYLKV